MRFGGTLYCQFPEGTADEERGVPWRYGLHFTFDEVDYPIELKQAFLILDMNAEALAARVLNELGIQEQYLVWYVEPMQELKPL